ncbi:M48 family metallopeptidase [Coraliomargarita akajimensis]|uniref:Ste24 endopeptidase n=1 Tax=Coraliomargarita akajimensis (strain DSM 45221 / IAM 15411 / JCM 23193 / KCTC 12865 / 04OKA010-24) TaxID=583355 RepID=D5EJ65_CORAD|nr:M48 family metallopeptidase [Coraliomargarita akajimensis]ADE54464.1 Ste24 endopeptidase [Coraliomargarita akajimensis DSM 45221]
MNTVILVFLVLLLLKLSADILLDFLNLRYSIAKRDEVPEAFRDFMDAESYQKSIDYTVAKTRFGIVSGLYDAAILLLVLLTGFLAVVYEGMSGALGYGVWGQALVLFAMMILLGLPGLPFDWWSTFRLEERFGFNKSTLGLWVSDKIKGTLIGFVIAYPLLALLIYLVSAAGALWWLWGFAAFFVFQLVMVVAYPMFIMPLFNKMKPLEEGDLKSRLFALADRTGFQAQTILVMDGSKRSGHSNAFFAGFGKFRRIVLYDTLIEQMEAEELEAVLAHEIGHYKLGHIPKMVAVSGVSTLGMFAALGWLANSTWFPEAFYFSAEAAEQLVPVLLLFVLLSGLIMFWLTPMTSVLSRKHEYEADAFARDAMSSSAPLCRALRKLHKENLSNLTPHPLYSRFHYSHPTLLEREASLKQTGI